MCGFHVQGRGWRDPYACTHVTLLASRPAPEGAGDQKAKRSEHCKGCIRRFRAGERLDRCSSTTGLGTLGRGSGARSHTSRPCFYTTAGEVWGNEIHCAAVRDSHRAAATANGVPLQAHATMLYKTDGFSALPGPIGLQTRSGGSRKGIGGVLIQGGKTR